MASDNAQRIEALESQIHRRFPAPFRDLLVRYSFPAFDAGPVTFFANTGQDIFWELGIRLFKDPHMSPVLLQRGFIQIGNPHFYNYARSV